VEADGVRTGQPDTVTRLAWNTADPAEDDMQALDQKSLSSLGASVSTPAYDRATVRPGIVHLGMGSFHRSHEAMYIDRLLEQGKAQDWGICGVGVLPSDRRMAEVMAAQDGLYTLVAKHTDGTLEPRVVGSVVEYLLAPDDPEAVVEKMAAETTRIVSLTVTEGGYNFSPVSGEFDATEPDVVADLQPHAAPRTAFGLVAEALVRRRQRGLRPFTVVSCDNIQANGDVARRSFTAFARLRDPALGSWMEREVPFPNSMVDRITPATTDEDRDEVRERFGIEDGWPVVCEPFTQWVLEERFSLGRPPLEDAGVQLVEDVGPYELMKLRLLNASHQALAYFGYLAGYRLVHDAAQDPLFQRFLLGYMEEEATPTLRPVPGIDLGEYRENLISRFSNPAIRDTLPRLAFDGSERIPKWLLPVIRENLAAGGEIRRSAAVVASWARYCEGVDEQGRPIEIADRRRDSLISNARRQQEDPLAFLADRELFGDLVDEERFTDPYRATLTSLRERGARATLEALAGVHGRRA
jgi:mannitol 2-dehydrogenase